MLATYKLNKYIVRDFNLLFYDSFGKFIVFWYWECKIKPSLGYSLGQVRYFDCRCITYYYYSIILHLDVCVLLGRFLYLQNKMLIKAIFLYLLWYSTQQYKNCHNPVKSVTIQLTKILYLSSIKFWSHLEVVEHRQKSSSTNNSIARPPGFPFLHSIHILCQILNLSSLSI